MLYISPSQLGQSWAVAGTMDDDGDDDDDDDWITSFPFCFLYIALSTQASPFLPKKKMLYSFWLFMYIVKFINYLHSIIALYQYTLLLRVTQFTSHYINIFLTSFHFGLPSVNRFWSDFLLRFSNCLHRMMVEDIMGILLVWMTAFVIILLSSLNLKLKRLDHSTFSPGLNNCSWAFINLVKFLNCVVEFYVVHLPSLSTIIFECGK